MKEFLCRVEGRFCIECCKERDCSLLGLLNDGTIGCQGHEVKTPDGISITPFCQDFNCLAGKTDEEIEKIRQKILSLPKGQFKMSEIIKT
ncbi:hypothetical protein C4578_03375 [Candidatus Microgenomates bacterium]|jgi:hypothetical protein|nr:MAG: hypothetical protein C4578_03375 [Candidatus Microgenomates bacterium]